MSELRRDPIHKRWVIISSEQTKRPLDSFGADFSNFCPFCEGNEDSTPREILARRTSDSKPDGPGWSVRVVPTKFPALRVEGELKARAVGLYDKMAGIGAHEVVIETPVHGIQMADMDYRSVERVVQVWIDRQRDLFQDGRLEHVLIFRNQGKAAGAAIEHSHSQIMATPVPPTTVVSKLNGAREYYQAKRRCLFCDTIEQEIDSGKRLVSMDSDTVVYAPYASRFPFELILLPRRHDHAFHHLTPEEVSAVARTLRDSLRRLKVCLADPAFNLVVHTAPNPSTLRPHPYLWKTLPWDYHWHIEIIPRLFPRSGFEWASGFAINPTRPEDAAAFLRKARI